MHKVDVIRVLNGVIFLAATEQFKCVLCYSKTDLE